MLEAEQFFYRSYIDKGNRLEGLFFTYPLLIDIYKKNYDVVILDCIYKTNIYGILLLYIVGVTRASITVLIAYAFIARKDYDKYR